MNDLDYLFVFSDKIMFWILQLILISLVVISTFKSSVSRGGVSVSIDRGKESIAIFYGTYISMSGLLVAICLSVEFIKDYRIIWVIIDILIVAYICIINPWSRNKFIGLSMKIKKLES
jgi:hypothetical protein